MQLPDQLLNSITGCGPMLTERSSRERRKAPRLPLSVRAALVQLNAGQSEPATFVRIRDISAGGIGFLHARPMLVGEDVVVAVPRKKGKPLYIHYSVVRCQRVESNTFVVGAQFVSLLWGGTPPPAAAPEPPPGGPAVKGPPV